MKDKSRRAARDAGGKPTQRRKTYVALILALSLGPLALAQPVAVEFTTRELTGVAASRSITITPTAATLLQTDGTSVITGAPLVLPAATDIVTNLWPGAYTVTIQGISKSFPMLVTTNLGFGPVPAVWFTTNLVWTWTNSAAHVTRLVAGANVWITPSNGLGSVTINATGGGSGGSVPANVLTNTETGVTLSGSFTGSLAWNASTASTAASVPWSALPAMPLTDATAFDATGTARTATNSITSAWLTNKIGSGVYDGVGVGQMWSWYATNPLGSAAYHAYADLDASGTAQTATNSITSAWLTGKIGTGVYDASGVATTATNNLILSSNAYIGSFTGNGAGLTNVFFKRRSVQLTDQATVTPNADTTDLGVLLTLSQSTFIANPTGTPTDGQQLLIRITSASAQSLSWGTAYRAGATVALPAATTGSAKTDYNAFIYNNNSSTWDITGTTFGY